MAEGSDLQDLDIPVEGAVLHVAVRGEGPTCLVLTAIGTRPYALQTAELASRLRLAYVDLRGGGRSTGEPADLTFDRLAADLEAVRTALGVPQVAVLGHSILGMLAIEYGRRCPQTVSHVVTVGTPPHGDMARVAAASAAFFAADAAAERQTVYAENLARLPPGAPWSETFYAQTPQRFFDPRLDARPLFADSEVRPGLLGHVMGTLAPAWDPGTATPPLCVPVLVAHGRYDYTVPHAMGEELAAKLPTATFALFAASGHQPFYEEPARFAGALIDWMGRVGGSHRELLFDVETVEGKVAAATFIQPNGVFEAKRK